MSSVLPTPFSYVLDRTEQAPPLDEERLQEVAASARSGDGEALEKLITSNTRLCAHIVSLIAPNGCLRDDLFSAALQGLTEAARTFDPSRATFSTHAGHLIRREIFATLSALGYPVCAPARFIKMRRAIREARGRLEQNGIAPTVAAVAKEARCKPDTVLAIHFLESPLLAIDNEPVGTGAFQPHCDRPTPASSVLHADDREAVRQAMAALLTPREREILSRLYGLDGRPAETFAVIGQALGFTRQRICQIAQGATNKLRAVMGDRLGGEMR